MSGKWEKNEALVPEPRAQLLRNAIDAITNARNQVYGEPYDDFSRTAGILNALWGGKGNGEKFYAHDVALIQMAVKMSRLVQTPEHVDGWMDIGGYAGCGYEAQMRGVSFGERPAPNVDWLVERTGEVSDE